VELIPSGTFDADRPQHPLWRANSPSGWAYRSWEEGELVLFDEESGSTHLLSLEGAEVALTLAGEPLGLNVPQLADQLYATASEEERAEAEAGIQATLLEFQRLGLAEPVIS
jgi:PqqD family protein of HPr-rel-A system